ncbi:hypothetical protein LSTR_LSTR013440 [Laodelphax striatellus]|uniref:Uncharacterized protein n=1 Tax=Laodelphax striatellus TaxID=195883 RepID=A0A482XAN9_LAOST|nr:hypothetical protein LSTR_LSTR013440 [Laodelphax striatellus]
MLRHKFFHRAKKVPVTEQELRAKQKKKEGKGAEKGERQQRGEEGREREKKRRRRKRPRAVMPKERNLRAANCCNRPKAVDSATVDQYFVNT